MSAKWLVGRLFGSLVIEHGFPDHMANTTSGVGCSYLLGDECLYPILESTVVVVEDSEKERQGDSVSSKQTIRSDRLDIFRCVYLSPDPRRTNYTRGLLTKTTLGW